MPTCTLCNQEADTVFDLAESCALNLIEREHPEWVRENGSCPKCKAYYESFDDDVLLVGETVGE
jgi:hypothetical protein